MAECVSPAEDVSCQTETHIKAALRTHATVRASIPTVAVMDLDSTLMLICLSALGHTSFIFIFSQADGGGRLGMSTERSRREALGRVSARETGRFNINLTLPQRGSVPLYNYYSASIISQTDNPEKTVAQ